MKLSTACVLSCLIGLLCWTNPAKAETFSGLKAPNADWQVQTKSDEVEVAVKSKPQAVNVNVKIMDDVPISAERFLDEVRTQLLKKSEYQSGKVSPVESKTMEGKTWSALTIKRQDEIFQEFWTRKLGSGKVLMVLYTAVGDFYAQYHPGFITVLKQASQDPR